MTTPKLATGHITDVPGLRVGHAQNSDALTGCTVLLVEGGAIAGVDVRGLAPGTREIALLRPGTLVERVHGILLTGGSAFGLAAADGVMRFLEEKGIGYDAGSARVPIVPAAVLYDLGIGNASLRPDAAMGYAACVAATTEPPAQGNVGAGCGATVGKLFGVQRSVKSGIGTASLKAGRLVVGALVAVNAFGDVVDPEEGNIVAGALRAHGDGFADTCRALTSFPVRAALRLSNTVIGIIASNARLDVAQTTSIASGAHDGLARTVRPAHTLYDGDTLFALSTGQVNASPLLVASLAADVVAMAVLNSVWSAEDAGGLPCARTLHAQMSARD